MKPNKIEIGGIYTYNDGCGGNWYSGQKVRILGIGSEFSDSYKAEFLTAHPPSGEKKPYVLQTRYLFLELSKEDKFKHHMKRVENRHLLKKVV